ncbi:MULTISPECIES: alpha/beta hydrolase family protein [Streptomyces]|uniref:Alpha/beta fold hydrolase n=1 Tax=Streptomyces caniscabiei TaxID=2746961 RepID=A0ABU4MW40_9ACTN|nr:MULTISPECIES: alpha/beta fold hydrolase [Streptomyces]MBE4737386.1 alpha/beta fold hydrolase [Streptomyces caniscabiei]MBE4756146.1 alpha/beta fold hydrolase [Streptomyces caniscabiei]MBE4769837.1 alpha/beta fold hydrolase [Streptomyces caniscabiei]MBE4787217.1 alpha/beta fold hydrolase [Streptomyces caniscabiei]MBE4795378.1 alpha/beta fold hydrolase [Streptomyces caniscabiei]
MIRHHDFRHAGLTLRSTLHIPEGPPETRHPTVVFVHGFTSNRIELPNFVAMSRLLAAEGIASVRFDLSGHGESDGDFFDVTITGEIAETRAVLGTVRTLDFVDPDRIGLVGMSMGGVVAGITAGDEGAGITALCLWSPAAVAPFEIGSGYLKGRELAPEIAEKGYVDAGGHRMSAALVADIAGLDVYGRSSTYTGPVHILHGDKDDIAPVEYARRYLDHYGQNAELEIVEGAEHDWGSIPHRTALHGSTLRFFQRHLLR